MVIRFSIVDTFIVICCFNFRCSYYWCAKPCRRPFCPLGHPRALGLPILHSFWTISGRDVKGRKPQSRTVWPRPHLISYLKYLKYYTYTGGAPGGGTLGFLCLFTKSATRSTTEGSAEMFRSTFYFWFGPFSHDAGPSGIVFFIVRTKKGFLLINSAWSSQGSSWKMAVHSPITISRRRALCIWSFASEVACKSSSRRWPGKRSLWTSKPPIQLTTSKRKFRILYNNVVQRARIRDKVYIEKCGRSKYDRCTESRGCHPEANTHDTVWIMFLTVRLAKFLKLRKFPEFPRLQQFPKFLEFLKFLKILEFLKFLKCPKLLEFPKFLDFLHFLEFLKLLELLEFLKILKFLKILNCPTFLKFLDFLQLQ